MSRACLRGNDQRHTNWSRTSCTTGGSKWTRIDCTYWVDQLRMRARTTTSPYPHLMRPTRIYRKFAPPFRRGEYCLTPRLRTRDYGLTVTLNRRRIGSGPASSTSSPSVRSTSGCSRVKGGKHPHLPREEREAIAARRVPRDMI